MHKCECANACVCVAVRVCYTGSEWARSLASVTHPRLLGIALVFPGIRTSDSGYPYLRWQWDAQNTGVCRGYCTGASLSFMLYSFWAQEPEKYESGYLRSVLGGYETILEFRDALRYPHVYVEHLLLSSAKMTSFTAPRCLCFFWQQISTGTHVPSGDVVPLYKPLLAKTRSKKKQSCLSAVKLTL